MNLCQPWWLGISQCTPTCSGDHKLIEDADYQMRRAKQARLFLLSNAIPHKWLSASFLEEYSLAHKGKKDYFGLLQLIVNSWSILDKIQSKLNFVLEIKLL